ncbi:globin domain-containing protein [uncultured Paraglaciecola sp.]|uniref:globin domain-containing protein n=1 Tax=uncultured Paraglaciecola sp. TaxID=1765024 RepID=UPI0030DBA401|tara:strand:+ start:46280 stop:46711 length:432 start_codon:yes stop_codon:yes gene_type:complete
MPLSIADKAAITLSFSQLTQSKSNVAESFYKNLFDMAPLIKPLFKSDRKLLEIHFNELFSTAVHKINHFEELKADLLALGKRHKSYQAKASHFTVVKSALLLSIQYELKGQCSDAVINAWQQFIEDISEVMIEGLEMQENPCI